MVEWMEILVVADPLSMYLMWSQGHCHITKFMGTRDLTPQKNIIMGNKFILQV